MNGIAINERTRGFCFLSCAILLAAMFSWYPLYRSQHETGMFSPGGFLLIYGLPIHFVTAWIAVRGFLILLLPTIRLGQIRASSDWIVLPIGGVLALAGASPLLIFAKIIMAA